MLATHSGLQIRERFGFGAIGPVFMIWGAGIVFLKARYDSVMAYDPSRLWGSICSNSTDSLQEARSRTKPDKKDQKGCRGKR